MKRGESQSEKEDEKEKEKEKEKEEEEEKKEDQVDHPESEGKNTTLSHRYISVDLSQSFDEVPNHLLPKRKKKKGDMSPKRT